MYFANLYEHEVSLYVDVAVSAEVADEIVGLGEEATEGSVGVDDGEFGGFPAEFTGFDVEVPDGFGDEEVVILYLSVEVVGWDVEEGLSAVEVEVYSVALGDSGLPGGVVHVGVEGVDGVGPGLIEALYGSEVLFLALCDHQVLVLDGAAVAQHHLALICVYLLDSYVVRLCVVFAEGLASGRAEIELGDAE